MVETEETKTRPFQLEHLHTLNVAPKIYWNCESQNPTESEVDDLLATIIHSANVSDKEAIRTFSCGWLVPGLLSRDISLLSRVTHLTVVLCADDDEEDKE